MLYTLNEYFSSLSVDKNNCAELLSMPSKCSICHMFVCDVMLYQFRVELCTFILIDGVELRVIAECNGQSVFPDFIKHMF